MLTGESMLYLLRLAETGREAQPDKGRIKADVVAELRRRIPGASVETATGRVFVSCDPDRAGVLGDIHGISSYSPCERCSLDDLEDAVLRAADARAPGAASFAVEVKRSGTRRVRSRELAARLGEVVLARYPHLSVDLGGADLVLGVEVRGEDCYVFDRADPGLDYGEAVGALALTGEPRFLVDQMLGHLVAWLRLLGFDTLFVVDEADQLLCRIARRERRILLTRDAPLAGTRAVMIHYVRAVEPEEQLREIAGVFDLELDETQMFTRCTACNATVQRVEPDEVADKMPAAARDRYDELTYCAACDKVYWKGDQYERIVATLAPLMQ